MTADTSTSPLFIQLLRVTLGFATQLERTPSSQEWRSILLETSRQGVVGVLFDGVERLPSAQRPPLDVLMDWVAVVDHIERENRLLFQRCTDVLGSFRQDGVKVCLLKGVGLGMLYPSPLRRGLGDIDLWMTGGKQKVEAYVSRRFAQADVGDGTHHISFLHEGVEVEVHHLPASLYAPHHNRCLRRYFAEVERLPWNYMVTLPEGTGAILTPPVAFNLVFVLVHLFHHWAFEGCGMKQVLDYYWLALAARQMDAASRKRALHLIGCMGLSSFLAALMGMFCHWGMNPSYALCKPDIRKGHILLADILATGIVAPDALASGAMGRETKPEKFFRRFRRMKRIFSLAPSELPWVLLRSVYLWIRYRLF